MTVFLHTLIVDDEPLARERLVSLLDAEPDVKIVGQCGDGASAVRMISQKKPDLVLLDIQIPEIDGFGVARAIGGEDPAAVIFVTAYDRFALQAFRVHAVDYLLKPVERDQLHFAVDRIRQSKLRGTAGLRHDLSGLMDYVEQKRRQLNRIALRTDSETIFVRPQDIDWIESAGSYVCFHVGNETHISRETMYQVEQNLEPHNFLRIHRSTIVNAERIKKLKPLLYGDYAAELRDGTTLSVSRTHKDQVLKRLGLAG